MLTTTLRLGGNKEVEESSTSSSEKREKLLASGLSELPKLRFPKRVARNGEELATDEAAVWKRVLNYRIARLLKPDRILETHPGLGISSALYKHACPHAEFLQYELNGQLVKTADLIDIDPFGQPWDDLHNCIAFLSKRSVLLISNGEAHAVRRNLKRGQRFPTEYWGRKMPLWVVREYIPRLEEMTGFTARFFYAFPTSVRVVLSRITMPATLWSGCPHWMWWLAKYAHVYLSDSELGKYCNEQ